MASVHPSHPPSIGRRLFEKPFLWQDWNDEAAEGTTRYWELFTDLLMVAAAISIADNLYEDPSLGGVHQFVILYFIITSGWFLYAHHFTSRFEESSLTHSFFLFLFMFGMAVQIVNARYATAAAFSIGTIIKRGAFCLILLPTAFYISRARELVRLFTFHCFVTICIMLVTVARPHWACYTWTLAALWDAGMELIFFQFLPGRSMVPINIEHTVERLGALVLVMLGETVISATITFRKYVTSTTRKKAREYYVVLGLAFLFTFMFTLLYNNVQPTVKDHALRRSRTAGTILFFLNKSLGMTLLIFGVIVKLSVKDVEHSTHAYNAHFFATTSLSVTVGSSLTILFCMRLCHFGGKMPHPHDPPEVRRLVWIWWSVLAFFSVLPFCFINLSLSPVPMLLIYCGITMILCMTETSFSHILEFYLPKVEETRPLQQGPDDDAMATYLSSQGS